MIMDMHKEEQSFIITWQQIVKISCRVIGLERSLGYDFKGFSWILIYKAYNYFK